MTPSRVVVATAYGGPEVLRLVDEEAGEPGPGEVLLGVRAGGANPIDWKLYGGTRGRDAEALPMRLGMEAAGVVVAVGPGASGPAGDIAAGDEVIAYRIAGGYADRVVVPAAAVIPKPPQVSFELGAGLMLAGVTAVHGLAAVGAQRGETVLLHGAAGAVGRIAIQLARVRGIDVVATAAPARHEDLRALGATCVAYGDGLLDRIRAAAPGGIDAAVDAIGTDEALDTSLALVGDRARIATVANAPRGLREGVKVLGGAPGADPGIEIRMAARPELAALAAQGAIELPIVTFALEEVAAAHEESIAGQPAGKLVLVP